jgi:hypothetical protein
LVRLPAVPRIGGWLLTDVRGRGGDVKKRKEKQGKMQKKREERVKIKLNWKVKRKIGGILC